jgi:hypothetical protein
VLLIFCTLCPYPFQKAGNFVLVTLRLAGFWWETSKGKDHLEDLSVDGRILLKRRALLSEIESCVFCWLSTDCTVYVPEARALHKHCCENFKSYNIKMNRTGIRCKVVDWIHFNQNRNWNTLENTAISLRVDKTFLDEVSEYWLLKRDPAPWS